MTMMFGRGGSHSPQSLFLEEHGGPDPLFVFLHGLGGTHRYWTSGPLSSSPRSIDLSSVTGTPPDLFSDTRSTGTWPLCTKPWSGSHHSSSWATPSGRHSPWSTSDRSNYRRLPTIRAH